MSDDLPHFWRPPLSATTAVEIYKAAAHHAYSYTEVGWRHEEQGKILSTITSHFARLCEWISKVKAFSALRSSTTYLVTENWHRKWSLLQVVREELKNRHSRHLNQMKLKTYIKNFNVQNSWYSDPICSQTTSIGWGELRWACLE